MRLWNCTSGSRTTAFMTAALLAVVAGTALGQSAAASDQPAQPSEPKFNYDRRLGGAQAAGQPASGNSVTTYVFSNGDHSYSVKIENGDVTHVEQDGKKIPGSRVRTSGDKVEILDESGSVVHAFKIPSTPAAAAAPGVFTWRVQPGDQSNPFTVAGEPFKAPPVMLGITMSEPDEDVVEHLGVKASEVIRIDSVLEGLPADQAGLKVADIVVAVDGEKPVNQERLREVLRGKKPGDTITLSIISKGKTDDIKVKLEAFDQEKLGAVGGMTFAAPQGNAIPLNADKLEELKGLMFEGLTAARPKLEEAKKALERSLAELKESGDLNAESMKAQAIDALTAALRSLEDASGSAARRLEMMRPGAEGGDGGERAARVERRSPQRAPMYITPVPSTQSEQFDRLTATLERMEKRLADLEQRLERRQRDSGGEERKR